MICFLFLCMAVFSASVYVYKRLLEPLELELCAVESCKEGAGNWTHALYKSNKWS